jgi:hypothetical protein
MWHFVVCFMFHLARNEKGRYAMDLCEREDGFGIFKAQLIECIYLVKGKGIWHVLYTKEEHITAPTPRISK